MDDKILIHSANSPDVYHWGIHGQQWGKRRYQNEDGSLTPLGRVHYGVGQAREASKIKIREMKAETRNAVKLAKAQAKTAKAVAKAEANKIEAQTKAYKDRKEADNMVELERIKNDRERIENEREVDRRASEVAEKRAENDYKIDKELADASKAKSEIEGSGNRALKVAAGVIAAAGVGYLLYRAVKGSSVTSEANVEAGNKAINNISNKPANSFFDTTKETQRQKDLIGKAVKDKNAAEASFMKSQAKQASKEAKRQKDLINQAVKEANKTKTNEAKTAAKELKRQQNLIKKTINFENNSKKGWYVDPQLGNKYHVNTEGRGSGFMNWLYGPVTSRSAAAQKTLDALDSWKKRKMYMSDNDGMILVHSATAGRDVCHYGVKGQRWGVITKKEDAPTGGRTKNVYGYTEGTYRSDQDNPVSGTANSSVQGNGYGNGAISSNKKYNSESVQEDYGSAVLSLGLGAAKAVLEGKMTYKEASDQIWGTMNELDKKRKEPGFEYVLNLGDGEQLFANNSTNNMSQFFQTALYVLRLVSDDVEAHPELKEAYLDAIQNGDFFKGISSKGFDKSAFKRAMSDVQNGKTSTDMPQLKLQKNKGRETGSLNPSNKNSNQAKTNTSSKLASASQNSLKQNKAKTEDAGYNRAGANAAKAGILSNQSTMKKGDSYKIKVKNPKSASTSVNAKTLGKSGKASSAIANIRKNSKQSTKVRHSDNGDLILVHSEYGEDVEHWGIKGQKWGVRRWQYEDGSLTPEGRIHYGRISEKGQQEGRLTGRTAKFNTREFNTLNRRMARNASKYEKTGQRKYAERALENAELLSNEKFVKNEARIMNDQSSAYFALGISGQILMAAANSSLLKEDTNIWNETKTKFQNMSLDELDKAFNETIGKTEKVKFNAKEMDKETKAKEDAIFKESKEYREIGGQYKNEKEARKAYDEHKKVAQNSEANKNNEQENLAENQKLYKQLNNAKNIDEYVEVRDKLIENQQKSGKRYSMDFQELVQNDKRQYNTEWMDKESAKYNANPKKYWDEYRQKMEDPEYRKKYQE